MKREELESISSELYDELDLDEQQYIVGQTTTFMTYSATHNPKGADTGTDYGVDWS